MKFFRSWFDWLSSSERRGAKRHPTPSLSAYYWSGGRPKAHSVRDISSTGLFLVTDERWYPRTLVRVTLQMTNGTDEHAITLESMVVRWGSDGVGLELLPPKRDDSNGGPTRLANSADRKTLEKFLKQVSSNKVEAFVDGIMQAP